MSPRQSSDRVVDGAHGERGGVRPRRVNAAFTLIELLIVVAIIAILAAIAVPNFIEAQVRSKVARTKTDLRTLATAVEAYRTDNNGYVKASLYQNLAQRLRPLTTPVAFISAVPLDPFYEYSSGNFAGSESWYCYASGNIAGSGDDPLHPEWARTIYSLAGRGPDRHYNFGGICMARPEFVTNKGNERGAYDPTNGTVSEGDIIRLSSNSLGGL